ncbi:Maf family protein [Caldinitratiruptor microaerophilus]|uniref:dTTP/UTP pyrophosphatase n=1 Tax=Caldinitratiruptor microaerophilus TaxID=671077 RepID=A0AA35CPL3_9FIRM|nr:Maf family protein [Caldinitratiruptor microaerophilus]BDG61511.1 Maf-like protein [Caldinitratiruptor microaerophilus]
MTRLVLASASPRRVSLLEQVGLSFEVVPSGVPEDPGDGTREPADLARALALRKAEAVAAREPDALVLGADTIVVLDGAVLGKPRDEAEAVRMLERLQGRSHVVITGVALVAPGGRKRVEHEETTVWMRPLTRAQVEWYVRSGEPLDKAGAYAVQGLGALLVERIFGCYYNVVGLPLGRVARLLEEFGLTVL